LGDITAFNHDTVVFFYYLYREYNKMHGNIVISATHVHCVLMYTDIKFGDLTHKHVQASFVVMAGQLT